MQTELSALVRRAARTRTPADLPHDPAVVVELVAQLPCQHVLPIRHAS